MGNRKEQSERQPVQKVSRRQQKRRQDEVDLLRRKLILGGLATAALVGTGIGFYEWSKPEEFSGEMEDTKRRLNSFRNEIGSDPQKLRANAQKIVNLASSYLSTQMQQIFPQLKDQYEKNKIKSRYVILDEKGLEEASKSCGRVVTDDSGTFIGREDKIYISPEKSWKKNQNKNLAVDVFFRLAVHEGIHSLPVKRIFSQEYNIPNIKEHLDFAHGLSAYQIDKSTDQFGNPCDLQVFHMLEEAITEDTTVRLLTKLGGPILMASNYINAVNDYKQHLLPLLQNDYRNGLLFHQTSNPFGFFKEIGKGLGETDPEWQAAAGINFTQQYINDLNN